MIPVLVNNPGLGSATRCGWLCRTLNKIADRLEGLPLISKIGRAIRSLATEASNFDNTFGTGEYTTGSYSPVFRTAQGTTPTDLPMTDAEAAALDSWFDTRFNPWFQQLSTVINNALSQPLAQKIQGVNSALITICTVKSYLQQYPSGAATGLSANAQTNRNTFVIYMMEELEKVISEQLQNTPMVNIEVMFNSVDLTPLGFQTGRMLPGSCLNYATEGIGPVRPQPETVVITTIDGPVKTPVTNNDLITQPTNPQPGTQPGTPTGDIVEQGQNFIKKNWLWGVGAFVVYKIFK